MHDLDDHWVASMGDDIAINIGMHWSGGLLRNVVVAAPIVGDRSGDDLGVREQHSYKTAAACK